jgi:hypothetical protein
MAAQVEQMQLWLALVASQPTAGQCMQVLSRLLGNLAGAPQVGGDAQPKVYCIAAGLFCV